jgi:hypothetical protein
MTHSISVQLPPERAFARFTEQMGDWWPPEYTWVEVRFAGEGDHGAATRVELEHRGFERHGEGAGDYQAAMDSPPGWPLLLERFADLGR